MPEVNSNQVSNKEEFKQMPNVDISVAVATENGLITPIVADADKLSVLEISERVKVKIIINITIIIIIFIVYFLNKVISRQSKKRKTFATRISRGLI